MWFLYEFACVLISLTVITIGYFKWQYQHWKNKGVPFLKPRIPLGNMLSHYKRKTTVGFYFKQIYDEMKSKNWGHGGIFLLATPTYVVLNLDILKNILTKDFQYFTDRGIYYNEKDDIISAHLFALGGPKWKSLRSKLTPTFTSGKMKNMFQTLVDCEVNLAEYMENRLSDNKIKNIDIKDVLGCFTTDIIGSCAFGLDCDSFKNQESPFRIYGKRVLTSSSTLHRMQVSFASNFPRLGRFLGIKMFPQEISDFYKKVVTETVNYREDNKIRRQDFLQLLIDLKDKFSMDEITAQAFIFFFAGFETSSTTMTFALYELSKNQEIQERVRDEIKEVLEKHNGKITYEAIQELKYMNQVIDETLRKYPPVPFITRSCVKDYKVPDADFTIDTNTKIIIPILGIHRDPEYYPDPEKFDPERFSEENKSQRHQYAHIPFGEGPRICIGLRFGIMQSKVGLASLLKNYRFTVAKKTLEPLKMNVKSLVLAAEGEIWLDAEKI